MNNHTNVPQLGVSGPFEVEAPFNNIVVPGRYYKVEQLSTISKLQAENYDFNKKIFEPAQIPEDTRAKILSDAISYKATVVVLTSRDQKPVILFSNYIKSFPVLNGVLYEHLCIVGDAGAQHSGLKDSGYTMLKHFEEYAKAHLGITVNFQFAYIETRSFVTKEQHEINENKRKSQITNTSSDVGTIKRLEEEIVGKDLYIKKLEDQLTSLSK